MSAVQKVEVYVFYFDVHGFIDQYLRNAGSTLDHLRAFQRQARAEFCFSRPQTFVATLYDNVWARINVAQPGMPSLLLDFAGKVMRAATDQGFPNFFGCITKGWHDYDPDDRMLVAKESFEDLTAQHLDITSEPHIRAVFAEKWAKLVTPNGSAVWVSSEVVDGESLSALASLPESAFQLAGKWFDIGEGNPSGQPQWPFAQSRFHVIQAIDT